jgi:endo-1,4-beta-xylanase
VKIHLLPIKTVFIVLTAAVFAGCATKPTTLKEAYKNDFLIGVAVNQNQFEDQDQRGDPIIKAQFDSISPENALKWASVHPELDQYDFTNADQYVAFGESNHMVIIGHTLVWNHQTPRSVFEDTNGNHVTREVLLERMHDHIQTVMGRYKGRIKDWDVVNEALMDDGTLRPSLWEKIIGPDYIEKAFQYAHEADPDAELNYNDFSLEDEAKRKGAIELIKKLKAEGIPINAVGLQGHLKMTWPSVEVEDATISDFAKLGVKVMITEFDVDVVRATQGNRTADIEANSRLVSGANTYSNGLPADVQNALAKRYAELMGVYLKHRDVVERVTLWGVTDGDSWLNTPGRMNHPLLFDREGHPKPAFTAVIQAAQKPALEWTNAPIHP